MMKHIYSDYFIYLFVFFSSVKLILILLQIMFLKHFILLDSCTKGITKGGEHRKTIFRNRGEALPGI